MAGSGHTRLIWPVSGPYALGRYPVEYYLYKDGLFVKRAARGLAHLVGGRVLRIGGRTTEDLLKAVEPLCSVDGPMGLKTEGPALLTRPQVLDALGVAADGCQVSLVVERPGGEDVEIKLSGSTDVSQWVENRGTAKALATPSLRVENPLYWFEHMPEDRLVYFQFNAVANRQDESLAAFCRRMLAFVREQRSRILSSTCAATKAAMGCSIGL